MKTPPSDLPPVPPDHVYIGLDTDGLNIDGCDGHPAKGFTATGLFHTKDWWDAQVSAARPPQGYHVAAPVGSRLHMLNSVPDGFDYYGMGPLKATSDTWNADIITFQSLDAGGWNGVTKGCRGTSPLLHYALRSGSPIALANGLVPPAPVEPARPINLSPYDKIFWEEVKETHDNIREMIAPVNSGKPDAFERLLEMLPKTTDEGLRFIQHQSRRCGKTAARLLVETMAEQIRTLKADAAKTPWAQSGETQEEWLARHARECTQYGYWERVHTALGNPNDGRSLLDQTVAAIEERDELLEIREMMTQQIETLTKSRDSHLAACKTWQEAFKQMGKHLGLGGTTGNAYTAVAEARKLCEERDALKNRLGLMTNQRDQFAGDLRAMTKQRDDMTSMYHRRCTEFIALTAERDRLKQELARLKSEIKERGAGWDVAANLRDEVLRLKKRSNDLGVSDRWSEVMHLRDEALRLSQELAKVRDNPGVLSTIIPEIIDEPVLAGCNGPNETLGYMASEISRLRGVLNQTTRLAREAMAKEGAK